MTALLYEGLLAQGRADDLGIDEMCDTPWVDVKINRAALAGWAAAHRPQVAGLLAADR